MPFCHALGRPSVLCPSVRPLAFSFPLCISCTDWKKLKYNSAEMLTIHRRGAERRFQLAVIKVKVNRSKETEMLTILRRYTKCNHSSVCLSVCLLTILYPLCFSWTYRRKFKKWKICYLYRDYVQSPSPSLLQSKSRLHFAIEITENIYCFVEMYILLKWHIM